VLHPLRTRDRGYCQKCHAFICDSCEVTRVASSGACVPWKQVMDRAAEIAERHAGQLDHPELASLSDVDSLTRPNEPKVVLTDA
jgi:predicted metal-binding protein